MTEPSAGNQENQKKGLPWWLILLLVILGLFLLFFFSPLRHYLPKQKISLNLPKKQVIKTKKPTPIPDKAVRKQIKAKEGGTLTWGVASVLKEGEPPPDLICDKGDWGKEPMVRILGPTPMAVAEKALALKNALQAGGRL